MRPGSSWSLYVRSKFNSGFKRETMTKNLRMIKDDYWMIIESVV